MRDVLLSIQTINSGYPVREPEPQAQVAQVGSHDPFGIMLSASGKCHKETLQLINQSPEVTLPIRSDRGALWQRTFSPDPVDRREVTINSWQAGISPTITGWGFLFGIAQIHTSLAPRAIARGH